MFYSPVKIKNKNLIYASFGQLQKFKKIAT